MNRMNSDAWENLIEEYGGDAVNRAMQELAGKKHSLAYMRNRLEEQNSFDFEKFFEQVSKNDF